MDESFDPFGCLNLVAVGAERTGKFWGSGFGLSHGGCGVIWVYCYFIFPAVINAIFNFISESNRELDTDGALPNLSDEIRDISAIKN